ncbi:hypothetical protein H257_00128 [Aphanomyces astaci]|uniref:Uncharacterized protein n=1 Tax=Aphanomyces astaci TaxID=112090 RepID=W4HAJ8_APHAT|nr:hypothetical protein H257_00128 [Aphanomyces astaci]ETV88566.1 hypothetical protein H257_00128 [Aphanomyces astaci]|eukprot:XP_009820966.1 hypothetical protein H257_00128 [Aphanomyces astaci]
MYPPPMIHHQQVQARPPHLAIQPPLHKVECNQDGHQHTSTLNIHETALNSPSLDTRQDSPAVQHPPNKLQGRRHLWHTKNTAKAEATNPAPTSTTTLARYRRLIGMFARRQAMQYLVLTASIVATKRHRAGRAIQRTWRRHVMYRRRICAATSVQRMWRGHAGRCVVKRLTSRLANQRCAAHHIGMAARRWRRRVVSRAWRRKLLITRSHACLVIQRAYLRFTHRQHQRQDQRHRAVVAIQTVWRRRRQAASRIQSWVRCQRRRLRSAQWVCCVTKCQAAYRMHVASTAFQALRHHTIQLQRRRRALMISTPSPSESIINTGRHDVVKDGLNGDQPEDAVVAHVDPSIAANPSVGRITLPDSTTDLTRPMVRHSTARPTLAIDIVEACPTKVEEDAELVATPNEMPLTVRLKINSNILEACADADATSSDDTSWHLQVDKATTPPTLHAVSASTTDQDIYPRALLSAPSFAPVAIAPPPCTNSIESTPSHDIYDTSLATDAKSPCFHPSLTIFVTHHWRPRHVYRRRSLLTLQKWMRGYLARQEVRRRRRQALDTLRQWMTTTCSSASTPLAKDVDTPSAYVDPGIFPVHGAVPAGCHVIKSVYVWTWDASVERWT